MFSILLLSSGFFGLQVGHLGRKIVARAGPDPSQEKIGPGHRSRLFLNKHTFMRDLAQLVCWDRYPKSLGPFRSWNNIKRYQQLYHVVVEFGVSDFAQRVWVVPWICMTVFIGYNGAQSVRRGRQQWWWYNRARASVTVEATYMTTHDNDYGGVAIATLTPQWLWPYLLNY